MSISGIATPNIALKLDTSRLAARLCQEDSYQTRPKPTAGSLLLVQSHPEVIRRVSRVNLRKQAVISISPTITWYWILNLGRSDLLRRLYYSINIITPKFSKNFVLISPDSLFAKRT